MNKPKQRRGTKAIATVTPLQAWGTIVGVAIGIVGYGLGWPMWLILSFSLSVPFVSLVVWLLTGTEVVRRYRFLFVVYGLVAVPSFYELWVTRKVAEPIVEFLNLQPAPGEASIYVQYDLPRYLTELYPTRVESLYARGYQIQMCMLLGEDQRQELPICLQLGKLKKEDVGRFFKAAVDTGNRGDEKVLYNYAIFLFDNDAPTEEINAAVKNWRWNFPFSRRPDPRLKPKR